MSQFQGVPGPSQDSFNSLADQIAKTIATENVISLASYTAKTLIDMCVTNGYKEYYTSATGSNKLSDLPKTQAGQYVVLCNTYYKKLYFTGTDHSQYEYDYDTNTWYSITDQIGTLNTAVNTHIEYKNSLVVDNVTITTAYKKTLTDYLIFYLDFELTAAKSSMDNVIHGFPYAINGASYTFTVLGHTAERESTTYKFSMTGDGYLKTLDEIPNGTRIRITFGYFT